MPTPSDDRDKLVLSKYILEAHGKERQLEAALLAQIAMTKKPQVRAALVEHLTVTRTQIRALESRLGDLRPTQEFSWLAPVEAIAGAVSTVANKAIALSKGPLQLLRGTGLADSELRNVRDCFWNEAEEIAHYQVIESLAAEMGDTVTLELAIKHRMEEEDMQRTLERFIGELSHDVYASEGTGGDRIAA